MTGADVIGFVGGRAVGRETLDRRIAELRNGPRRSALPVPGSAEDRQLARWLTQVILTETLCEDEAARLGLAPVDSPPPDRLAAVELGSVNAAAYLNSPWVRAVYRHVTATAEVPPAWRPAPVRPPTQTLHLVHHRLFPDRESAARADTDDLEPLGAVTLESLPTALAEAIRSHPPGTRVGPVQDSLGWHLATAKPAHHNPARTEPAHIKPACDEPPTNGPANDRRAAGEPGGAQRAGGEPADGDPFRAAAPVDVAGLDAAQLNTAHPNPARPNTARPNTPRIDAARRLVFARWLDERRAERVRLVPGLEHPGDPRQPDNHHKHG